MAAAMAFGMGAAVAATNEVSGLLQKGLFEEEANRNLDAAIKAYQGVITQTEKDRQFAATAIFRLGECYRKQGNTNDATVQYQRILREFPDQAELAKLSRQQLGPGADLAMGGMAGKKLADELRAMSPEKRRVAVQQKFPNPVLNSLMEKMVTTEQELVSLKGSLGLQHPDVLAKETLLKQVEKQVDEQVDGVLDGLSAQQQADASGFMPVLSSGQSQEDITRRLDALRQKQDAAAEQAEIKNIQVMVKDNPDLINAYNGENTPLLAAVRARQFAVVKFLLENKADTELKHHGVNNEQLTPLIWATRQENKDIVDLLLEHGANVDATDVNRKTALHWAADHGFKTIAETLLAHKAEVDAREKDDVTPLRMAAQKGFKSIAEILVAHGADVNSRDNNRVTPLQSAASVGNRAIVEWLLANKADVNAADSGGWTPLTAAIRFGKLDIARMLLAHGADVEGQTGGSHQRPMFIAVQGNWPEGIKLLLEHHADVNATCGDGTGQNPAMTPLTLAANAKLDEVAHLLIDAKADVNQRVSSGRTALMFAVERTDAGLINLLLDHHADPNIAAEHGETPLLLAVQNNLPGIAEALISHGANVNATFPEKWYLHLKGAGVLQLATGLFQTNMVKLLLEHGANTETAADTIFHINNSTTGVPGFTPLLTAVYQQNSDFVQLLLDHKAEPSHADREGMTPLHWAIRQGFNTAGMKEIAELLLAAKADINARDKNGQTPLHLAASVKSSEMVEFLVAHGADVNAKDNNGKTPLDIIGSGGNAGPPFRNPGATVGIQPQPGGSPPFAYQWYNNNGNPPASGGSKDVASILREHGGVSETELSTIRVVRKGDSNIRIIVRRDPNSYNHCTLFEVIACVYSPPDQNLLPAGNGEYLMRPSEAPRGYRFPDFGGVRIHRLESGGRTNSMHIHDLGTALAAGDCSINVELRWGDVVEIPEADHKVEEKWPGLPKEVRATLVKCLQRNVDILVKGQVTKVTMLPQPPFFQAQGSGRSGSNFGSFEYLPAGPGAAEIQIHSFRLNDVVHSANVILASSDLTRVKVRRTDPATGKKTEMTFNLEKTDPETDLWLKDGDVIELPEKSNE